MTQFVSHVAPPSAENAYSQIGSPPGFAFQVKRTLMGLPSIVSVAKKTPTQPEKPPMTGTSGWCGARPSSHHIAHVRVCGSNERKAAARTSASGNKRTMSSTLPNPPRIFRANDTPESSVQSAQPARRALSRRWCTRQSPMIKSKSVGAAFELEVGMGWCV